MLWPSWLPTGAAWAVLPVGLWMLRHRCNAGRMWVAIQVARPLYRPGEANLAVWHTRPMRSAGHDGASRAACSGDVGHADLRSRCLAVRKHRASASRAQRASCSDNAAVIWPPVQAPASCSARQRGGASARALYGQLRGSPAAGALPRPWRRMRRCRGVRTGMALHSLSLCRNCCSVAGSDRPIATDVVRNWCCWAAALHTWRCSARSSTSRPEACASL